MQAITSEVLHHLIGYGMQLCGVTCVIGLIAECVKELGLKIVNSFYQ